MASHVLIYESCVVYVILAMLSDCTYSYVWLLNGDVLLNMPYISYITGCYLRVLILSQRSATGAFTLS